MKCKLLKGESDKISSLLTYKPRHVHGWNEKKKQSEPKIVQGLSEWLILSMYTPKLDSSKISNLSIDRVYPICVHYGNPFILM